MLDLRAKAGEAVFVSPASDAVVVGRTGGGIVRTGRRVPRRQQRRVRKEGGALADHKFGFHDAFNYKKEPDLAAALRWEER
ncbi:hypothetical protein PVAP13_4NG260200 [Panicum virgatum]|uniref:Uncharacterized protein n=1 Tax=Panicum virgatum TaxID=38727 RepID=A0A8T0T9B3_PANVG|nr:hypothetical protein PVAP13_4NG260200 [Panicum virgatum]